MDFKYYCVVFCRFLQLVIKTHDQILNKHVIQIFLQATGKSVRQKLYCYFIDVIKGLRGGYTHIDLADKSNFKKPQQKHAKMTVMR